MTGNFDITIQSSSGEVTFYGSKWQDDGTENVTGYQTPLDGLGDPGRRVTSTVKSGADGGLAVASDMFYEMRQISLDAFAMCDTNDAINDVTSGIRAAMPIREQVLLLVTTPQGTRYGAKAIITKCAPSVVYSRNTKLLRDYSIEILAPDPSWYDYTSDNLNQIALNKSVPGGLIWGATGLSWTSSGLPWSSGSGSTVVVNTGTEIVFPTITITGIVHNPIITNVTTGLAFQLSITTSSTSDVIAIDMDSEVVTLNGATIMNNISTENWWGLMVGNNTIDYNSSTSDDTAQVVLSWRNRYMEII